ncbi:MAG TPA: TonB family protein [Luteimonas sp.]|nr:TonB family protein [Luteimonas sp.]
MASELLGWLLHQAVVLSLGLLLVMALRLPVRHAFGARVAYMLWLIVPAALLALALPGPAVGLLDLGAAAASPGQPTVTIGVARMLHPMVVPSTMPDGLRDMLLALWLSGMLAAGASVWRAQLRFRRVLGTLVARGGGLFVSTASMGPVVIGVLRPRIVLPADFESRYPEAERALVLAHERIHVRRGDVAANLLATALACIHWFNPLVRGAAAMFRLDQELACDAAVLSRHPRSRRTYADAMLKAQLAVPGLPVGCHWQSSQPLKERIHMLKAIPPSRARRVGGRLATAMLLTATSFAAWALQPGAGAASPPMQSHPPQVAPVAMLQAAGGASPVPIPVQGTGEAIHTPAPPYPPAALAARQDGRVLLHVLVGTNGQVRDVRVVESEPKGVFDAVSVEAARAWTLAPVIKDGEPVEAWQQVPIDFAPDRPKSPATDVMPTPPAPPATPAAAAPPPPPTAAAPPPPPVPPAPRAPPAPQAMRTP